MYRVAVFIAVAVVAVCAQDDNPFSDIDFECLGREAAGDSSLLQCQPDGQDFSPVCTSSCRSKIVAVYRKCGAGELANLINEVCATDDQGRVCAEVLNEFNDPSSEISQMISRDCTNATAGCSGQCREAVEGIGCCYGSALNVLRAILGQDTVDQLGVSICNDIAGCNGATMTAISTLAVLIAALLFTLLI